MSSIVEILVNVKDNATSFFSDLADRMSGASAAAGGLSSTLKTVAEVLGLGALGAALAASVEAWAKWQQSVVELNAALSLTGQYSEAASAQIQAMAEHIQAVSSVSKQSALGVSEMAAAFTHLQPTQLADLQKAAVGFQAVFGGGMEHAASLFSRSLEGSGIVLRRYGVDIDASMSESERFHAIMNRFGPMFEVAVSGADTLAGRFEQMKNQFVDLERTVGDLVTRVLGLQTGLEGTKGVIETINDWIKAHGAELVTYGTRFVNLMTALIQMLPSLFKIAIDELSPFMKKIGEWINDLNTFVDKVILHIVAAQTGVSAKAIKTEFDIDSTPADKHLAEFKEHWNAVLKALGDFTKDVPTGPGSIPLGTVTPGAGAETNLPSPYVQASDTTVVSELISQQKKLNEQVNEGSMSFQDYLYWTNKVRDALLEEKAALEGHKQALIDEEKTGKDNNLALQGTEVQINRIVVALKSLGEQGDPEVKRLAASIKDLDEQYKTGVISLSAYQASKQKLIDQIKAEIAFDVALMTTMTLTKDQTLALTKSIAALREELQKLETAGKTAGQRIFEAFAGGSGITAAAQNAKHAMRELGEESVTAGTAAAGAALAQGTSVAKALKEMAKTESAHAFAKALEFLAEAIAAAATGNPKAGGLFAASAEMFAAGEAFKLIGGGGGGSNTGSAGGGGGGGGATATSNAVSGLAAGVNIYLPSGFTNSQAFLDEMISALEQGGVRNVHVLSQG